MTHTLKRKDERYFITGLIKRKSIFDSMAVMDFATKKTLREKISKMKKDQNVTSIWVEPLTIPSVLQMASFIGAAEREKMMRSRDKPKRTEVFYLGRTELLSSKLPKIRKVE